MGFEAPVSYENTWEGMKMGGGGGPSARVKHPHTYEGRRADRHLLWFISLAATISGVNNTLTNVK